MADKPILFSGPMVRALLAGSKTQTRRALSPQPEPCDHSLWRRPMPDGSQQDNHCDDTFQPSIGEDGLHCRVCGNGTRLAHSRKSGVAGIPIRYRVGDRLYVREHWRTWAQYDHVAPRDFTPGTHVAYEATESPNLGDNAGRFRQGMHMPRWASRLTLTVTDVRVERLQNCSEADARAEGVLFEENPLHPDAQRYFVEIGGGEVVSGWDARDCYGSLWEHINGAGSWAANPWVTAYSFTVEHGNIDVLAKAP